jgi:hypothetical protein
LIIPAQPVLTTLPGRNGLLRLSGKRQQQQIVKGLV